MRAMKTPAVLMAALLTACTGGNSNPDGTDPNCEVNCTDPGQSTLTVMVTAGGESADCDVNDVDGDTHVKIGMTGDVIPMEAGSYDISIGSADTASLRSDRLPIHYIGDRMWIYPVLDLDVSGETTKTVALNQYIEDVWTCLNSTAPDVFFTEDVTYENGEKLTMDGAFSGMMVEETSISYSNDQTGTTATGSFLSATELHIDATRDSVDFQIDCWMGDEHDRP